MEQLANFEVKRVFYMSNGETRFLKSHSVGLVKCYLKSGYQQSMNSSLQNTQQYDGMMEGQTKSTET